MSKKKFKVHQIEKIDESKVDKELIKSWLYADINLSLAKENGTSLESKFNYLINYFKEQDIYEIG